MGVMRGHRGLGGGLGEGQSLEGFETRFCCSCCVRLTSTTIAAGADWGWVKGSRDAGL